MKNKIFFVIIMMLGLVLILSLSGCATVKPEEIVGKYHAQNQEDAEGVWLEIKGDNTWVDSTGASGTYKIVQEEIIFESGDEVKFSGTFVDGVLTLLKDGEIFGVWEKEIVSNPGTALKFEQVYAYAQEAGYTGTLEQLIEAFKGDSAYQLAVLQGYKGSEKDWLESLKGVAGKDGKTPTIGINGNWWIGDLDMGISATGKDGNGILKIEKDENNMSGESSDSDCYIIYFTNGTTTEFYIKKGQQGQKGNGIESVEKTGSEGLIDIYTITFTDGTTTTFTVTNGKSAYDLAVENGYRGTVEEWLASLVGEAGATGKSAYELAVENGYEGSEEQWLNSLVGSTGETGAEGKSAYDLAVENGYEGTLTEWLATLVGTPGATGATGVGIRSIEKTGSEGLVDTYTITFTDGTTTTFTVTNAPSNLPVTVVFDARGGVIENSYTYLELTLIEGEDDIYQGVINAYNPIEILPIPVRQGLQFCGWYTGTTINDGQWLNNNTVSGDLTLYARWTTHPFVHIERTEPTCSEDGNIEYRYCPDCDLYFADAACTVIIEEEDTVLAALGHDYVTGVINPTCTEQGCTVHTCSRCEDRYCDNQTEALGHDMTLFEEKAPTCTEDGYKAHAYCARCEEYFADDTGVRPIEYDSIVLTAIGHNYRAEVVAPTCSQKGYTEYTCENCGDVYRDHYTNRLAHEFEDGQCIHCHTPQYSEGLEFTLVDNTYYSVTDVGTAKENIVIPAVYEGLPVRAIGDYAFRYCADIKTVTIPSSVTSIGGGAFRGCTNLTSVEIPRGVTGIDGYVFEACRSLTNIEIPESVRWIGSRAFSGCRSLTSVIFGGNSRLININSHAFSYCASLTSIAIPNSLVNIEDLAFYGCKSLTNVTLPASVRTIGFSAFSSCSSLTSVTFGENSQLTSIDTYAFENCRSLTSIEIPASVERIFSGAFYGCDDLSTIEVVAGNQSYRVEENCLIEIATKTLILGRSDSVIPSDGSVEVIAAYAFYNCTGLRDISIPFSVTSIGQQAFYNCISLTSVTIPDGVTSIGYDAFYGCSSLTSIEIPSSVTSIGNRAFSGCSSLTSIEIPSSVTSIGGQAFYGCSSLTSIEIPSGVTSIGDWAFYGCSSLTSIEIPSSVTSIGASAFSGCSSLTSIEIPSGVTSIGSSAFRGCSSLTSILIPSGVTSIGDEAFWYCRRLTIYCEAASQPSGWASNWNDSNCPVVWDCSNNDVADDGYIYTVVGGIRYALKDGDAKVARQPETLTGEIAIPASITYNDTVYPVTSIGDDAFAWRSSLTSVTFGANSQLTSIGDGAFRDCTGLTSVTIPASVTSIGWGVFSGCTGLTAVTIPASVASIGSSAFSDCSSLTIYCEAASQPSGWTSYYWNNSGCPVVWDCNNNDVATGDTVVDGIRYVLKDGEAEVVRQSETLVGEIVIPTSITYNDTVYPVTSIGDHAFLDCRRLTNIVIPSNVINIGKNVFSGCSGLTSVTLGQNSQLISIGDYAFRSCASLTSVTIPDGVTSIRRSVFSGCTSLTSVTIPDSVTSIGDRAFSGCSSLTSVTFVENSQLASIGDDAFNYCRNLTSIDIPSSVTSIGYDAFSGCSSLTSVTFGENSQLTSIGGYGVFENCSSLTSIEIPDSVTNIGSSAFRGCSSLTSVTFGENSQLTSIGYDAFSGCSSLTSIEIPASVTSIGSSAFWCCSNLTSIAIPNGVTSIGGSMFAYCSSLTSIEIPSSVTSIGGQAFYNCSSLTSIEIPSGVTSIGGSAFEGCSGLTSIEIPSSVTSIGYDAFRGCSSLTSVTFGENSQLTSIGESAFQDCSGLTSIEIPSSVASVGNNAFYNCSSLTSVTFGENSQLTSIGYNAFSGCSRLTTITFGENSQLTSIGSSAFQDCSSLIVYFSDIAAWAQIAFGGVYSNPARHGVLYLNGEPVLDLVVPGTAGRIADFAFYQASRLRSVRLEEGVNVIGQSAFFEAERLKVVYIPKSVTEISAGAFGGCGDLETIYFAGTEKDWAGIVKASDWDVNTGDYEIIFASELNEYAVSGEIFAADVTENYADNEVVGGASVIVTGEDGVAYTTTADDRGRFSLSAIREGAYTLTISKEGYLPVSKQILVDSNLYLTIVMDFDATNTLSGKVTIADADTDFSNNLPLEGADVSIERTSSSNPLTAMVQTGADGMYRIEGLTIGRYTITVSKEGYKTVKQLFTVAVNQVNIQNIVLEAIPSSNVNDGYAAGKIIDSVTGAGVRGLQLYLYKGVNITSGTLISRSVTEENGRYRTEALEPGNYTIKIVDERELSDENLRYQDGILVIKVLSDQVIDNQNGYVTNNASLATDSLRIVLTWGATPRDLDSHLDIDLADGTSGHTWYSDKNYTKNGDLMADLDLDDTTSYGPETTTVYEMEQGVYTFYVHDYTNLNSNNSTALATSGAKVEVYLGNSVTAAYVFYVPDRAGTLWEVFSYNSTTGILTPKNNVTYHSSPSGIGR